MPASGPCSQGVAAAGTRSEPVLAAAALLSATVVVDPANGHADRCVVLASGEQLHLRIGDRAELVANRAPDLTPETGGAVQVSTQSGPTTPGPGGLASSHVIVTISAVHLGTVTVRWIDCSGTGC